ncbi:hypothetical protein HDU99_010295 [Rhizoclosmatium hyalinum]|nr:hypothetical protein HDU99_010295 [Rhizoclosmatium hyalinum]
MQEPFEQLIITIDEDASATKLPAESTPFIPPEIWSRIFVMAFGNMKQLSRISRLCKSVYYYCWLSPAAKANFYFECYGKRQAIFMAFATKCYKVPQFKEILMLMIQNGAKYSCLDQRQGCPLLTLSVMSNSVELIELFYSCQPHISKDHLRNSLMNAGKLGRLDIICALLQKDPSTISSSEFCSLLQENDVRLDVNLLLKLGRNELAYFLTAGNAVEFSPHTIALAIGNGHLDIAKAMIDARVQSYETDDGLDRIDSGHTWYAIWSALGFTDIRAVESALALGVQPLASAMQYSSGVVSHCNDFVCVNFDTWDHLNEVPKTLNPLAFEIMDLFLKAGCPFTQHTIINVASSGNAEYLKRVLDIWAQRADYLDVNLINPIAVHNAFMWRNWELVEILLASCRTWLELNNLQYDVDAIPLGEPDSHMNDIEIFEARTPFPMHPNDTYYFEKVPLLVKLGVYSEPVYAKALEEIAFYSQNWELERSIGCMNDLLNAGATVTSECLYNATVDGTTWELPTPRFKHLLKYYKFDPEVGWDCFDAVAAAAQRDAVSETIQLLLEKGVPVTMNVLLHTFQNEFSSSPTEALLSLFKAVQPGDSKQESFLEQLETFLDFDLWESGAPFYQELFLEIRAMGFRTTENVVTQAESKNKPILSALLKTMIENNKDE